jgi:anaerobic ribonucleoside-triphosphate reductase
MKTHHPQLEEHERQRCEVWTRVMGYHRPVSQFNRGKQSEHRERKFFTAPEEVRAAVR